MRTAPFLRAILTCLALTGGLLAPAAQAATASATVSGQSKERVMVVLRDHRVADPQTVAHEHERRYGGAVRAVYRSSLHGYVAEMPAGARHGIARDPRVAFVERDQVATVYAEVPTGVDRIEADRDPTADIDGVDERVDVDLAIIDTGVDPKHPDLNVVGGARCISLLGLFAGCRNRGFADDNGHGTHVAGIAAARDDGSGVVGVAPGARLWAVKVANAAGGAYVSDIVAGIDWVTARAGTIEVANMSLGCQCRSRVLDEAVNRSTEAGVVYVVAAGNSGRDAAGFSPANHPRAIAVSAMADFDGKPGGLADATCRADADDTFADFSNYGSVVDLAAPGVCITSTWPGGGYHTISGSSMASPHVAGAAALYILRNDVGSGSERWWQVREGLRSRWAVPQGNACGFTGGRSDEPMLMLAACDSG
ncbi:MAG: S8 family peptidase [Actinomycetota bacterium]|nr:S8 family peptidase [Actinomycetota bacterium]